MIKKNANHNKLILLAVIFITLLFGIYMFLSSQVRAYQVHLICSTPNIVGTIKGRVVDGNNDQPLADVQVTIKNTTPEESICPNVGYISEEQLITDAEGYFMTYNTVHPNQKFTITFQKEGCNTSIQENVPAIYLEQPLPDDMITFRLDCGE